MASEWKEQPLSNLCSYLNRGAAPAYTDAGGVLVLNQKCVRDQRVNFAFARRTDPKRKPIAADRIVQPFDILVNSTGVGTLGRVAQVHELPEIATVDSHVTLVRPDQEIVHPLYLGLALRCFEPEIEALGQGSTGQTELSRTRLGEFRVPVPASLSEQRAIAETLGALDDRIDNLCTTNATLEAIAAALFKSWFLDFDGMAEADMQESELGLIPKGWRVASLNDHVDTERGLSYKGAGLSEAGAGVPMHNLNSVLEFGGYKYAGIKYYSGEYKEKHVAVAGDIIVANTEQGHEHRLIGFPAIVPASYASGLFSHHLYRVRIKEDSRITREWLYRCLMAPSVREQIIGCANGSTVNMLKPDGLKIPRFALPPYELCEMFDAVAAPLRLKAEANVEQMGIIAAIRDALLPRLISGQLRVNQ